MNVLVIGIGEVGSALVKVLRSTHTVHEADLGILPNAGRVDVLNICFPYTDDFIQQAHEWANQYHPETIVIHSTVPVGTTRRTFPTRGVHSPVNGRHPRLESALKTFRKAVASVTEPANQQACAMLEQAGVKIARFSSPEASELAMLLSTLHLGLDVKFAKQVHALCADYQLPYDEVYKLWTAIYNDGYDALGEGRFHRPILEHMPGKIGGHCVVSNAKLLPHFAPARDLIRFNDSLREN